MDQKLSRIAYLTECLQALKPTGPLGFEGLVRDLLEISTGFTFRIARSGSQHGHDMKTDEDTEVVIAVEAKRYRYKTELSARELLGELTDANLSFPDLDLWVLVAPKEVGSNEESKLKQEAHNKGIDILILDTRESGLGPLQLLCAEYAEITIDFLSGNSNKFEPQSLSDSLTEISKLANFSDACARFKVTLKNIILGFSDTRIRLSKWFLENVSNEKSSIATFGQDIAVQATGRNSPIKRDKIHSDINKWWGSPSKSTIFALIGEEGTGKTWAIVDWLAQLLKVSDAPIIIPITSKYNYGDTFQELISESLARATRGAFSLDSRYWSRKISRWLYTSTNYKQQIILFLDGLNERPNIKWTQYIDEIVGDNSYDNISVILTCRPRFWDKLKVSISKYITELTTEGYEIEELNQILIQENINIDEISDDLKSLLRKPRYCDLALKHFSDLMRSGDFTIARLLFEDYKDRMMRKRSNQPVSDDQFHQIIGDLARRYKDAIAGRSQEITFGPNDFSSLLPAGPSAKTMLQEIIDGGILIDSGQFSSPYKLEPTRLIYGLGMLLADDIHAANDDNIDLIADTIQSWLEPQPDMDMKTEVLGMAVFFSIVNTSFPEAARRALLREWIGVRNMSEDQERAIQAYLPDCIKDILAIIEYFWQSEFDNGAAQDRLFISLARHRDHPNVKLLLISAIEKWLSYVHIHGRHSMPPYNPTDDRLQKAHDQISKKIGRNIAPGTTTHFQGLQFEIIDDAGLLNLNRLAFYLISLGDRESFIDGFIKWSIASELMEYTHYYELAMWAMRLTDEDLVIKILPEVTKMAHCDDITVRKAAYTLCKLLGSREAHEIINRELNNLFPPSPWLLDYKKDPCVGHFLIEREDCATCLLREDVPTLDLAGKIQRYCLDPTFVVPERFIERLRQVSYVKFIENQLIFLEENSPSYDLDHFIAILSRFIPDILAENINKTILTIKNRNDKEKSNILISLSNFAPILKQEAISLLRSTLESIRANAPNWSDGNDEESFHNHAEAAGSVVLTMFLHPSEVIDDLLSRPPNAFDSVDWMNWAQPISEEKSYTLLAQLLAEKNQKTRERLTWIAEACILSELNDSMRQCLIQLYNRPETRGISLKIIYHLKDFSLIRHVLESGDSFSSPRNNWGDWYGCAILCRDGREIDFETILKRVTLVAASHALEIRGCKAHEVFLFAEAVYASFSSKLGLRKNFFQNSSNENLSTVEDSQKDATNELPDDVDNYFWQCQFNIAGLRALCRNYPKLIVGLMNYFSNAQNLPTFSRITIDRFSTNLIEALCSTDSQNAFAFWERLRGHPSIRFAIPNPKNSNLFYLPFKLQSNDAISARKNLLELCKTDLDIQNIAIASAAFDKMEWVFTESKSLIQSPQLWRKAKGFTLAALSDIPLEQFRFLKSLMDIANTWVGDIVENIEKYFMLNLWAKHWYSEFLTTPDNDISWSRFQLFLKCVDRRYLTWISVLEKDTESHPKFDDRRIKFRATMYDKVKTAYEENEKLRKNSLFTLKVTNFRFHPRYR